MNRHNTESDKMSDSPHDFMAEFNARQRSCIYSLAEGCNITQVASELAVSRCTINRWRQLPGFDAAVRRVQAESHRDRMIFARCSAFGEDIFRLTDAVLKKRIREKEFEEPIILPAKETPETPAVAEEAKVFADYRLASDPEVEICISTRKREDGGQELILELFSHDVQWQKDYQMTVTISDEFALDIDEAGHLLRLIEEEIRREGLLSRPPDDSSPGLEVSTDNMKGDIEMTQIEPEDQENIEQSETHILNVPLTAGRVQIDCYRFEATMKKCLVTWNIGPLADEDGDFISRRYSTELIDPQCPVEVHIIRDTLKPSEAARLLRKVANELEERGFPEPPYTGKLRLTPGGLQRVPADEDEDQ